MKASTVVNSLFGVLGGGGLLAGGAALLGATGSNLTPIFFANCDFSVTGLLLLYRMNVEQNVNRKLDATTFQVPSNEVSFEFSFKV